MKNTAHKYSESDRRGAARRLMRSTWACELLIHVLEVAGLACEDCTVGCGFPGTGFATPEFEILFVNFYGNALHNQIQRQDHPNAVLPANQYSTHSLQRTAANSHLFSKLKVTVRLGMQQMYAIP